MPNLISDFIKFMGTDFEPDILPIIPSGAKLKADSRLSSVHLGRIPGKFLTTAGQWIGFAAWLHHQASKYDLERWQAWQTPEMPVAIGLNMRRFNAFDVDSNKPEIALRSRS